MITLIHANNTVYEMLRVIKAYNVNQYGVKAVEEQQQKLQKIVENNKQLTILATNDSYIICQEIEEAKYTDIVDNKLLENPNEKI